MIIMLTKKQISSIRKLENRKERDDSGLFVAEGEKLVRELLSSDMAIDSIYATGDWIESIKHKQISKNITITKVSEEELGRISFLKTPNKVLAIIKKPADNDISDKTIFGGWSIFLDTVQDPGNMGTILRLADWFGFKYIVCSSGSADIFQPKVVQSTMGAISRVNVIRMDAGDFFERKKLYAPDMSVYGTFLDGDTIYGTEFCKSGILVMGNESRGISSETAGYINSRLLIPPYPKDSVSSESLNVAVATAIVCSEIRRQNSLIF